MTSGAAVFVLIGASISTAERARNFINTLAKVEAFLAAHAPPFIARIYRPSPPEDVARGRPGSVEMALDRAGWEQWRKREHRPEAAWCSGTLT